MIWLCGWDQASIEAWLHENRGAHRSGNVLQVQQLLQEDDNSNNNNEDVHDDETEE